MKITTSTVVLVLGASAPAAVSGFSFVSRSQPQCFQTRQKVQLQMALFDGMKDAFNAPPSTLDAQRETPIDRWMGWNTKPADMEAVSVAEAPVDFVDSMEVANYFTAALEKPMGIVFEENEEDFGGMFVLSLNDDGAAAKGGIVEPGDQLVAVNDIKVSGMAFDEALGAIVNSETDKTQLTFFRGTDAQLYGPTGASQEW
eukprot:CAMPEP_0197835852 /NCGR_PEP_ID=MMETSP1437-20131217/27138_1 /TAXON_ID=49252 ORGANISM="Eucampia antarctica, Strain CCMP1452" /NCGR_SAMPLE_ID=MMETSP1437 /ASSEMBLY_ACC=CAM_ASM_001096 /LENGTH=199 /DNA_ID=CAMNT_0043441569 /DNA_START=110 /DNA_END=706 /DNA_ORIENTATION=+